MKIIQNVLIIGGNENIQNQLKDELRQTRLAMRPENILAIEANESIVNILPEYRPELIVINEDFIQKDNFVQFILRHHERYGYAQMPYILIAIEHKNTFARLLQAVQNESWFLGFVLNPTTRTELDQILRKKLYPQSVIISWKGEGKIIPIENIAYLEKEPSGGRNLFIYEWTGKKYEKHTMRVSLRDFITKHLWSHPNFEMTYAAYAVNTNYVRGWNKEGNLMLKNVKKPILVSDQHKKRLKKKRDWF